MHISSVSVSLHCSHSLKNIVQQGHQCGTEHGHTYRVSIELAYMNQPNCLLADFGVIKKAIKARYDHQDLNKVMELPPTAENLAEEIYWLLKRYPQIDRSVHINHVTVAETENNITTFIPEEKEDEDENN